MAIARYRDPGISACQRTLTDKLTDANVHKEKSASVYFAKELAFYRLQVLSAEDSASVIYEGRDDIAKDEDHERLTCSRSSRSYEANEV